MVIPNTHYCASAYIMADEMNYINHKEAAIAELTRRLAIDVTRTKMHEERNEIGIKISLEVYVLTPDDYFNLCMRIKEAIQCDLPLPILG